MNLYSAQSADDRVLTLYYCKEDNSFERIITFACDTLHNSLLVICGYYDCGWDMIKSVFDFDAPLTGLHFGYRNGDLGLYLFFDKPLDTSNDRDNITRLWTDSWLYNLRDYVVTRVQNPIPIPPEVLQKSIWIGDDNYYAPGN